MGEGSVLFIIRHSNDLELMLPVMLCASNPIVFFRESLNKGDFRITCLEENNIPLIFLRERESQSMFLKMRLKFYKLALNSLYIKKKNKIKKQNDECMLSLFSKALENIDSRSINSIVFDHTSDFLVNKMISKIRLWASEKIPVLSLPHGVGTIVNSMQDIHLVKLSRSPYNNSLYDVFVCNDVVQSSHIGTSIKKTIIPSLRYTNTWVSFLQDYLRVDKEIERSNSINILIIHSKSIGNLNIAEVTRCIKIISQFECFNITIKPHPRGEGDMDLITRSIKKINISKEHMIQCVSKSDYVISFQSSAVYDAFIMSKTVIFPRYVTSNKLTDEFINCCHTCESPDDFYKVIKKISLGAVIEPHKKYIAPSWSDTLCKYQDIINTHSKYA